MNMTPRKGDLITTLKKTAETKTRQKRVSQYLGYRPGGFFVVLDNTGTEVVVRQQGELFIEE